MKSKTTFEIRELHWRKDSDGTLKADTVGGQVFIQKSDKRGKVGILFDDGYNWKSIDEDLNLIEFEYAFDYTPRDRLTALKIAESFHRQQVLSVVDKYIKSIKIGSMEMEQ